VDEDESRWWWHGIAEDKRHPWRHYRLYLHDRTEDYKRSVEGHIEWCLLRREGHGFGLQFGRNGSESDIGLDVHVGRLGSVFTRFKSPWTEWARIEQRGDDDRDWYKARHYRVSLFPHKGCWFVAQWDARANEWSRGQPWYREINLCDWHVWGRVATDTTEEGTGECMIPMPEGTYRATWEKETRTRRYVRWPGKVRNYWQRPHTSVTLDIPGGIPHWGKGENSWDCGMDGLCGCGGSTLEEAIGRAVSSSLRDRERYGGPHNLPHPMTITEAEAWELRERAES
jgi:hypothetical protein